MIVTIRNNNGFYKAIEAKELTWKVKDGYDFRIKKNEVTYKLESSFNIKFYAPTIIQLLEVSKTY